jgi:hypothetical protein
LTPTWRASVLPDTQVTATRSASGDAAAYRSARLLVDPGVDVEDEGSSVGHGHRMLAERFHRPRSCARFGLIASTSMTIGPVTRTGFPPRGLIGQEGLGRVAEFGAVQVGRPKRRPARVAWRGARRRRRRSGNHRRAAGRTSIVLPRR